jgi:hypothetical protein
VACCSVGVENWVGLAEDGLGVEIDSLVVRLVAICFVTSLLELGGILFALLLGESSDCSLIDLWKLGLALN